MTWMLTTYKSSAGGGISTYSLVGRREFIPPITSIVPDILRSGGGAARLPMPAPRLAGLFLSEEIKTQI